MENKPYLNTNIIIHMIHQFISAEPPKRKRSPSSPSSGSAQPPDGKSQRTIYTAKEREKDEQHNAAANRRAWETTLRFEIRGSCNGQRGRSEIIKIEILEGSPESAERAFEVMAQYNESKFSFLRGFQMWALSGMWNKNSKTYNEDWDIQPPMPGRLPAFFAQELAKAKFPGKTAGEKDTEFEGRLRTHIVTLTFVTKWKELGF